TPPDPRGAPRTRRRAPAPPCAGAPHGPSSRSLGPGSSFLRSTPASDDGLVAGLLSAAVRGRQLPRDAGHHDTSLVEQAGLEPQRALVVQYLLPPVAHHVLGDVHGHHVPWCLIAHALHVVHHGTVDLTVRGLDHLERNRDPAAIPFPYEGPGLCGVDVHRQ